VKDRRQGGSLSCIITSNLRTRWRQMLTYHTRHTLGTEPGAYHTQRQVTTTQLLSLLASIRGLFSNVFIEECRFLGCGSVYFLCEPMFKRNVPPKRRLTQEVHSPTSKKTAFFIVTAVKTSNLTMFSLSRLHSVLL
jgi:hypothetical protein